MSKSEKRRQSTKKLVFSALMVAMSIIIGIICKAYFTVTPITRITFDTMPILLLGIMFGPVYSVTAAVSADVVSALIAGYAPTPLITVGSAVIGLLAGVIPRYIIKRKGFLQILSASAVSQLVGSLLVKTYALADLYGFEFLPTLLARIPFSVIIAAVEAYLVFLILKNKQIRSFCLGKGERK